MAFKNGIFTRGVLFDIPKLKGVAYLGDDEPIYPEDLEAWEKKAGFRLESGDAMLVRTGRWLRVKEKGPLNLNVATPGLYASCCKWMRERGVAILGSDVVQDVRPSRVEGITSRFTRSGTGHGPAADRQLHPGGAGRGRRQATPLDVPADHQSAASPGATGGPVNPIATF